MHPDFQDDANPRRDLVGAPCIYAVTKHTLARLHERTAL